MRRWLIVVFIGAVLTVGAYLGLGYSLYHELVDINGRCFRHLANSPTQFTDLGNFWPAGFDYTPYFMPEYKTVSIPSRDPAVTLAGWYIEAAPDAPAVLIVHGFGSCKNSHTELVPAGMLHKAGFSVLIIDLRDAGDSTQLDGYTALGNEEYLDVLGAWDWLVTEKGIPAGRVGILGNSVGGAVALVAMGEERGITAVFADSPPSDLTVYLPDEARRNKFPTFMLPISLWWSRQAGGVDLLAHQAKDALPRFTPPQQFAVIHSRADIFVDVAQTERLEAESERLGLNGRFTYFDNASHMAIPAFYPAEYEKELVTFFQQALQ
ncbi:MAG: alpha/beta fold hydrolase [Anaerolineales bacterium]|nr:alpha/beta fold hydrolase [Anaerolineales bacterium]